MTTGYSKSCKGTGSLRCQRCLPPAAQRALKKSVPLLADRRKPTGHLMNLSLKTGFGSVCSVVPRIRWTFCRWIEPGTALSPNHDLPGECRGSHFGGRGRFQSVSVAGMGRSYEHLPQRQIFHEIQQVHPAPAGGGYRKDFMPEDTEAGQIQGFLEHYTGNMVCSNSCSRRLWDIPLMSRSGGSSTISMRS